MTRDTATSFEMPLLSTAERERMRETLARIDRRRDAMLRARGGRLCPPAGEEIDHERDQLIL